MRYLNRLAWAVAALAVTAATGSAQQVALPTGTTTTPGGVTSTTTSGGQLGGQQMGQGGQNGQFQGTQLVTFDTPPEITAPTGTGGGLDASNRLGAWYANPLFQGATWDNANVAPGGFGQPTYGTGAGGGRGTQAGRLGTQTGRLGTQTGRLGTQNAANQSGTVLPMQVNIAYPAVPRFDVSPLPATQVQADVSGMLSRAASQIPAAANVQAITNGNTVTLRGTVADVEEARLLEGMTRLTPGVRMVRNELTFPVSR